MRRQTVYFNEHTNCHEAGEKPSRHWFLSHILIGRLLVLCGAFLALSLLEPRQSWGFYLFATFSFLTLLPYTLWIRNHEDMVDMVSYQFLLDVVITTGIVHYTGGIDSLFFVLYPLIILASGIVVGGAAAIKIGILAAIFYSLLTVLERQDWLGLSAACMKGRMSGADFGLTLTARNLLFLLFAGGSAYISGYISWQTEQIERYASLVETILDHVPVGLMTIHRDQTVGLLNRMAIRLMGKDVAAVLGKPVASLFVGAAPDLGCEGAGRRFCLCGPNGGIDVACEVAQTVVPDLLMRDTPGTRPRSCLGAVSELGRAEVNILTVRDIGDELAAEKARQEVMRLRTTIQVVNELAHHVRNALTAIHGASYLTSELVNAPKGPSGHLSAAERQTVMDMTRIVGEQVEILDRKISEFLTGAAENPAEVVRQAAAFYAEYFGPCEP